MALSFSIASFKTEMDNRGTMRPSQFVVTMGQPPCMAGSLQETKTLALRCESASIPDVTLATQEIIRYGFGPLESTPYTAVFSGVNLTFVLDKTSFIYRYFNRWLQAVVNFNLTSGSMYSTFTTGGAARHTLGAYQVGYKDDYTTQVNITVFDDETTPRIQTTLHSAYPKAISAVDLNWGGTDVVRMNVAMAFREYSTITDREIPRNVPSPEVASRTASILANLDLPRNESYTEQVLGLGARAGTQA